MRTKVKILQHSSSFQQKFSKQTKNFTKGPIKTLRTGF